MIKTKVLRDAVTSKGNSKKGDVIEISEQEYLSLTAGYQFPIVQQVEHQEAPVETQQAAPLSERDEKPAKKSPRSKKKN